ncbi:hypothetical protein [Dickeya solani]|uniref:Uncharacterized protein n=1 Tax=Dickeya solani TaxID=1089444 RepID=A0ABU4EL76_9GAMM|nr:hypothetical protein [Dickeya solani]MCA7001302.1 hypothetical protein [Dickeya solani]MDV6997627.1 hypothetical protein [Dickeya solani]MDV7006493.1 hypothetical protein [Dickeya solani]MDV7040448.1 hypothetical protein [Dickeya solani]MDV7044794.1 hypothetical protein [Dickeya solani]
MKKTIKALLILTLGLGFNAGAVHLTGDYPVCLSEDAFERLSAILKHKDQSAYDKIMKTECTHIKAGLPVDEAVSLGTFSGVAHVKVYAGGRLIDLWTNSENVTAKGEK